MISVETALSHLFELVSPVETEWVNLTEACGRVLAQDLTANRNQPPFAASAMDGYAVAETTPEIGMTWTVTGEAAAGHAFDGNLAAGTAIRIFTGAPVPNGANRVIIQEDINQTGDKAVLINAPGPSSNIRALGADFKVRATIAAPKRLGPNDIALFASMNHAIVPVFCKPVVAIIATGDELVQPGENPGSDQIIASNSFGLHAMIKASGGLPRLMPIARDNVATLKQVFSFSANADLIVTIGGASVGDHDLVAVAAKEMGLDQSFYKVAMRPGKPLMAGRLENTPILGLPGNPVSAMVCGEVFLKPMLRVMSGLPAHPANTLQSPLAAALPKNGPRAHYMRAQMTANGLVAAQSQDSALLTVLSTADALIIREPNAPDAKIGDIVNYIPV